MHGMYARHAHACGCGPSSHGRWQRHFDPGEETGFGVRRPLRFLAWRLQLDDTQVTKLAGILNELKTERAQAAVDDRRSLTAFADAVSGESFDEARATEAAGSRVKSAERLQAAVKQALSGIHAVLDAEQRERLAYLIRTGALML